MHFAQPLWLLGGALACALVLWQFRRFDFAQRRALTQFASARLLHDLTSSVSPVRQRIKRGLFVLGIGLLFVALARPQAGFTWQETHRKGLALLFAVDTSKSMLAQDVKPDRLARAKLAVTDLVAKLNGDGVGLIAFAGNAFLQCPVTLDYDAFRESLNALDTNTIPRGGTDIAAAIHEAEAVFKTRSSADKILVLITDGEDLGGEGITAAEQASKEGVKIFTVGVGGTTGELVPIPSEKGGTDFARDENGQLVRSHLDAATLKKIAEATGGMYQPLGAQGEGLTKIYDQGLAHFTREDLSARQTKVPRERFYWPLVAALICLVGEMLIGNRRRMRAAKTAPVATPVRAARGLRPATVGLALLAGISTSHAAIAQNAEQAYAKGDFAQAQKEYAADAAQQPANARLHFNTGAAAYKAGDYAMAATGFEQSLKTDEVPVQHDAYYNLGNTQYRFGQKTEQAKPEETIKTWQGSVKSYDAALQIAPNDSEAKHNRALVQKKIDQLKKQQEQKKKDQQKQDQKNQPNQDKKDQSKNQAQNQQNKSQDQQKDSKDQSGDSGSKDQQQAKNDQSNGQQPGAQPTPGQEKKDQQQANAGPSPGEEPKPLNAEKKPSQGKAEAANGQKANDAQQAAAAEDQRSAPGQMTKAEAKQLLDALKGDERKVPAISALGNAAVPPNDNPVLKDW